MCSRGRLLVLAALGAAVVGLGTTAEFPGLHRKCFRGARVQWPLRLRGGGAGRCKVRDALQEWVRNASVAAQAHVEAHPDSEVSDSSGEVVSSSASEWTSEDLERAWDENAALRWAEGITTPHPHHLKWNMSYFNERHLDATEGAIKFDERFRISLWNSFCALRDRMLKNAGVYESYFLEDGVPPPNTDPVPLPGDSDNKSATATAHAAESPDAGMFFLGEAPPSVGPEESERRR